MMTKRQRERERIAKLIEGIKATPGVKVKGPKNPNRSHGADRLRAINRRVEMKKGQTR